MGRAGLGRAKEARGTRGARGLRVRGMGCARRCAARVFGRAFMIRYNTGAGRNARAGCGRRGIDRGTSALRWGMGGGTQDMRRAGLGRTLQINHKNWRARGGMPGSLRGAGAEKSAPIPTLGREQTCFVVPPKFSVLGRPLCLAPGETSRDFRPRRGRYTPARQMSFTAAAGGGFQPVTSFSARRECRYCFCVIASEVVTCRASASA